MAQELLLTLERTSERALRPDTGGLFRIDIDGEVVWDWGRDGGFPDAKTRKRLNREKAGPGRAFGHVDRG